MWSQEDQLMRAIFALSDLGRSKAGDVIWEQKIMPKMTSNTPKLREFLLSRMQDVSLDTKDGVQELSTFEIPTDRVDQFLVRLTKGFIRNFYPDYDYNNSGFSVRTITPDADSVAKLLTFIGSTKYAERGDGVVRFRYGITNTGLSGVWLYIFYDVAWFLVFHQKQALDSAPVLDSVASAA
jgi:hypothetical protein